MWIPANIANDGSEIVLQLKMNPEPNIEARANYDRFTPDFGIQLGSRSGELRIRYDGATARMHGSFWYEGVFGADEIEVTVTNGNFDLTGITAGVRENNQRTDSGSFTADSAWGKFIADQVSIESKELPGDPVGYWEVIGRMDRDDGFPGLPSHIMLFIKKDIPGYEHDLEKNDDVWVHYFRPDHGGGHLSVKGTLSFTSLPGSGHAKGKLAGFFQQGEEEPVEVKGEFDIKDEVAQS
ncbi:hypothetical protein [Pseudomonas lini]|uniref:hypothetical protein n=2 Tax=Pseudomonas TaxID=286 RepID=UPI0006A4705C|nr:hypothetical protein [Pseudomonas lini]KNH42584.1 hypothetical protein ACS73_29275 [Pseudomonas lini]